jgi:hypothetical protein
MQAPSLLTHDALFKVDKNIIVEGELLSRPVDGFTVHRPDLKAAGGPRAIISNCRPSASEVTDNLKDGSECRERGDEPTRWLAARCTEAQASKASPHCALTRVRAQPHHVTAQRAATQPELMEETRGNHRRASGQVVHESRLDGPRRQEALISP